MVMPAVKEKRISDIQKADGAWSGEAVAFCPRCRALQTVWIDGNKLMTTRKFHQVGSKIYHDCGSSQPCRLYRNS
jgi:hypothetical protein